MLPCWDLSTVTVCPSTSPLYRSHGETDVSSRFPAPIRCAHHGQRRRLRYPGSMAVWS